VVGVGGGLAAAGLTEFETGSQTTHPPTQPTHPKAERYVASWVESSREGGSFLAYGGMKQFTFDVLVNQVLELGLPPSEVAEMSSLFQTWSGGFMPPDIDLPFTPMGKGMRARCALLWGLETGFCALCVCLIGWRREGGQLTASTL